MYILPFIAAFFNANRYARLTRVTNSINKHRAFEWLGMKINRPICIVTSRSFFFVIPYYSACNRLLLYESLCTDLAIPYVMPSRFLRKQKIQLVIAW